MFAAQWPDLLCERLGEVPSCSSYPAILKVLPLALRVDSACHIPDKIST